MPRANNGMKVCTGCGETKPVSAYQKQSSVKDGLRSRCRSCRSTAKPRPPKIVDGKKVCSQCQKNKSLSEYYVTRTTGRVDSACKDCVKEGHRLRRRETEEWKFIEAERLERKVLLANKQKFCPRCETVKALEDFPRCDERKDGYGGWCKGCKHVHYDNDRERILSVNKEYRDQNRERLNKAALESYYKNKRPAIYQIECSVNGKVYIGQSSGHIARWKQHRSMLGRNRHPNSQLQRDFNEYDSDAFKYSVIEEYDQGVSSEFLLKKEADIIKQRILEGRALYNCLN
jgi:hypothetical protein